MNRAESGTSETNASPSMRGAAGDAGPNNQFQTVYASDPVCGMDVGVAGAQYRSEVADETYYFCSQSCKIRFDKHPEKYL